MENDLVQIKTITFPTLVAVTPDEHATGLMWKKWPPPVMCFPYRNAEVRKFWMKNCLSPLDIVFCKDGKVISICYGEPLSTKQVGPNYPSDLVVELPHGTAVKCGINVGDDVKLQRTTRTIARDIQDIFKRLSR